jgi:hypothetical protein
MVWHPRLDHDPAQQWLRDTIRSLAAAAVGVERRIRFSLDIRGPADDAYRGVA